MAAYIIVRAKINDPERYKVYLEVVPSIITRYGGRTIVRGGKNETLEGEQENRRIVVLKFPSIKKAKEFYYSKEYQEAKKLRENIAPGELLLIEGIE